MTQEEKSLLLENLCARLPYGVNVNHKGLIRPLFSVSPTQHYQITLDNAIDGKHNGLELVSLDDAVELKPYLRPMSSMTEEEREEFRKVGGVMSHNLQNDTWAISAFTPEAYDWLNAHYFDYRGLIPMGIALEAEEGMYKFS